MELLGEASVVEGRQVEQVFTKNWELKFKRPTQTLRKVSNAESFSGCCFEGKPFFLREKKTPPENKSFFHLVLP
jgi:hypothetical protein